MAQRTVVELLDDIDGKPADETVSFGLDGTAYEIDLSAENAKQLRAALEPFAEHARRSTAARGARATARTVGNRERSAEIRRWAKDHDIPVNERGRIPATLIQAFERKDPSLAKSGRAVPTPAFSS